MCVCIPGLTQPPPIIQKDNKLLKMLPLYVIFFLLGLTNVFRVDAVEGPGPINDLPQFELYVPEKKQDVPVLLGERSKFFLTSCYYNSVLLKRSFV